MRIDGTRQRCQGAGDGKDHHLVVEDIDPERFGGILVLAYRFQGDAHAGIHQVPYHDEDDEGEEGHEIIEGDPLERIPEEPGGLDAHDAFGSVREPLGIEKKESGHETQGQCRQGEVVVLELQGGNAYHNCHYHGKTQSYGRRHPEGKPRVHLEEGCRIGTYRVEGGMSERYLARVAEEKVEAHGQKDHDPYHDGCVDIIGIAGEDRPDCQKDH
ncbi:MAG: hypothetical protein A4E60_03181 [Syntrophorhabdus sp. PtaB.Bin047]|nr:MAG: hypothetical protein A4E60_03181 [Syntrophorhabdus sp. PtaB.Bin047]